MGFSYPLFFIALLALAIPILIHLFNLRRYKKMEFPSLHFLKQYIVQNQKMSQVQKKLLLLSRLLALLFIILAFTQPYWDNKKINKELITVLYIDNSASSNYKISQLTILDKIKEQATAWINAQSDGSFIILSNDNIYDNQQLNKQEAKQAIASVKALGPTIYPDQLQLALDQLPEHNYGKEINALIYSDMQASSWSATDHIKNINNARVKYFFIPIRLNDEDPINVSIDTCHFIDVPSESTQSAMMVTTLKKYGDKEVTHNLDINVDGKTNASKTIVWLAGDSVKYDTTQYPLTIGKWNKIKASITHPNAAYDNDFYIAARAANSANVLILSSTPSSPYLSSAINATGTANAVIQTFKKEMTSSIRGKYPLIIFDQVTTLSDDEIIAVKQWLEEGQGIGIFFGKRANVDNLNNQLKKIAAISIKGIDTTLQQTVDLQTSHPLLTNVLASIPDNIQLPYAQYAYKLNLGITTAAQPVIKFRDGSPFLAQMQIGNGRLYMCASPLNEESTSLVTSHYFAPIMQKMLTNNAVGNIFAATIGQPSPIWLAATNNDERTIFRLKKDSWEAVPLQQPKGMGINIFLPTTLPDAGHYLLTNGSTNEDIWIGINQPRIESDYNVISENMLSKIYGKDRVSVVKDATALNNLTKSGSSFPLWKVALIIALIWMGIETYLLWRKK